MCTLAASAAHWMNSQRWTFLTYILIRKRASLSGSHSSSTQKTRFRLTCSKRFCSLVGRVSFSTAWNALMCFGVCWCVWSVCSYVRVWEPPILFKSICHVFIYYSVCFAEQPATTFRIENSPLSLSLFSKQHTPFTCSVVDLSSFVNPVSCVRSTVKVFRCLIIKSFQDSCDFFDFSNLF